MPLRHVASKIARDKSWQRRLTRPRPEAAAWVGQIASGEKVVADEEYRAWLRATFSDALAIENEGFALARAAEVYADGQRYVVRGISDDAGRSKSDDGHANAADAAAAFAFELLDAYSQIQAPAPEMKAFRLTDAADSGQITSWIPDDAPSVDSVIRVPEISSVSFSGGPGDYKLTIEGAEFGVPAGKIPHYGTLPNFRIANSAQVGRGEWGYTGSRNHLTYESWEDRRIVVSGLGASPGDAIVLALWNDQTNIGVCWGQNVPPVPTPGPVIDEVIFSGPPANPMIIIRGHGFGPAPTTMPCTRAIRYLAIGDWRQHPQGIWAVQHMDRRSHPAFHVLVR